MSSLYYYLDDHEHRGKLSEIKTTIVMSCDHVDVNYKFPYCSVCGFTVCKRNTYDTFHFIPTGNPIEKLFEPRFESDLGKRTTLRLYFPWKKYEPQKYKKIFGTECFDFKEDLKKYLEDRGCKYHEDRLGLYNYYER
jgi:hypothetical protein